MRCLLPLLVLCACGPDAEVHERSLLDIAAQLQASGPVQLGEAGIELTVDQRAFLMLPLPGARAVTLELTSDSAFTVFFLSEDGNGGPPARYRRIDPGSTVLRANLLETEGWSSTSRPVLRFDGTGHVVLRRIRSTEPTAAAQGALDRALRFMPESVGHTTINVLTPPLVAAQPRVYLTGVVAVAALVVLFLAAIVARLHPRRWAVAFASAGLAAFAVFDAHFLLVRYLPIVRPLRLDPEARIAKNYYFAAEVGELAALARKTLPLSARVGVLGRADDWFGPQTLCFNLQPRPCVYLKPTAHEHVGIGGWPLLRDDELDAIVVYDAVASLPGNWKIVAKVSDNAYVALRP